MACEHMNFRAQVDVNRLIDEAGEQAMRFSADIHIACLECGVKFRFLGSRFGASAVEPMLSADALELRTPIEPAYTQQVLGRDVSATGRA